MEQQSACTKRNKIPLSRRPSAVRHDPMRLFPFIANQRRLSLVRQVLFSAQNHTTVTKTKEVMKTHQLQLIITTICALGSFLATSGRRHCALLRGL